MVKVAFILISIKVHPYIFQILTFLVLKIPVLGDSLINVIVVLFMGALIEEHEVQEQHNPWHAELKPEKALLQNGLSTFVNKFGLFFAVISIAFFLKQPVNYFLVCWAIWEWNTVCFSLQWKFQWVVVIQIKIFRFLIDNFFTSDVNVWWIPRTWRLTPQNCRMLKGLIYLRLHYFFMILLLLLHIALRSIDLECYHLNSLN